MIPLSVPQINGNEWKYLKQCLDTNWVSSAGPFVDKFESLIAEYIGAEFSVATNSGTSALHLALKVSGVKENDEVFVSTLSFIAPINAIRYVGAWPIFVDAEPKYWQMDPDRISDFINENCEVKSGRLYNKKTKRTISAILPVHILGHPCDMDAIMTIAKQYNLIVIEDASQSLGSTYKSIPLGTIGDIGCFSFNGNKTVTCGGGGMLVTNNGVWADSVRHISTQARDHPIEYTHDQIGYNYRLTNLQAAVGCAQIEQIDTFLQAKRSIANKYNSSFADVDGITTMPTSSSAWHSYWLYTILIDESVFGKTSRQILSQLQSLDIQTRPLWQPIHKSKAHQTESIHECPIADRLAYQALSLPSSSSLDNKSQAQVIEAVLSA